MITSTDPELDKLLQEGIRAYKQGDSLRARDLFMRVVEINDRVELAWLWLFEVVSDPADKVTALENALDINPANVKVRQRLESLRAQLDQSPDVFAPPPPSAPAAEAGLEAADAAQDVWQKYLPGVPLEADDGIDDPFQCVYCGRQTLAADQKCPHCGKKLFQMVQQSENSEFFQMALLLIGITMALGLLQVAGPFLALSATPDADRSMYQMLIRTYRLDWFLGNFLTLSPRLAQRLILLHVVRGGVLGALIVLLTQRWAWTYYLGLALIGVDALLGVYLLVTNYAGLVGALAQCALAIAIAWLIFSSDREFAVNRERLTTIPDPDLRSAADFYRRGHQLRRRGMWALAVAQWRRAVSLAPREAAFYKDLGIGYAKIKRYQRSLRVLQEAQRMIGEDPSITELIELVSAQAAKDERPPA